MKVLARIALTLCIAASLSGQAASAASVVSGHGIIEARDAATGIVTIDGRRFTVAPDAVLRWSTGEPFSIGDLKLGGLPEIPGLYPIYAVDYQAVESTLGLVLIKVTLFTRGE